MRDHQELREAFLVSLSPWYDNIEGALRVLNELRLEEPEKVLEFPHLAVATAVVWDSIDAVYGSRYSCVRGVTTQQYLPLPKPLDVFRYYSDKKLKRSFVFKVKKLVWPLAVYLVDNDVCRKEADWALYTFKKHKKRIGDLYAKVKYDYSKLKKENRSGKLGSREYILPNLLEYGGICGDQAHFCSRVAKCFAIPAMKSDGLSRYGGTGHAFTCFFVKKKGRPVLESTGRYFHDFYYTGNVFDPQTRVPILDRHVAMVLDGAALSYEKYMLSSILVRIADAIFHKQPEISLALVKKALAINWFCGSGWKLLMRHIRDGSMPRAEGITWANHMMKYVKDHPDLTFKCFSTFLGCIPEKDTDARQSFYKQAFSLYGDRPDLQVDLRYKQGLDLIKGSQDREAMDLLIKTAADHAKQGRLINPLVEEAIKAAQKLKIEKNLLTHLDRITMRYPKKRGDTIAESFKELVRMVAPVFEANGRRRDAARIRAQAEEY